jgi:hypothetical protein
MLGAFGGGALAGLGFVVPAIVTIVLLGLAGVAAGRLTGLDGEAA